MRLVLALTAIFALAVVSPVAADSISVGVNMACRRHRGLSLYLHPRRRPRGSPKLVVVPGSPVF